MTIALLIALNAALAVGIIGLLAYVMTRPFKLQHTSDATGTVSDGGAAVRRHRPRPAPQPSGPVAVPRGLGAKAPSAAAGR